MTAVPGGYSPLKIIEGSCLHIGKPDNGIKGFHVHVQRP